MSSNDVLKWQLLWGLNKDCDVYMVRNIIWREEWREIGGKLRILLKKIHNSDAFLAISMEDFQQNKTFQLHREIPH